MNNDSKFSRIKPEQDARPNIEFYWEDTLYVGKQGDTIAAALLAAGIHSTRISQPGEQQRAPYCMMGSCFECRVEVNGESHVQSCVRLLEDGMKIRRQTC